MDLTEIPQPAEPAVEIPLQTSVPSTSAVAENLDAAAEALAQMASRQLSRKPSGDKKG